MMFYLKTKTQLNQHNTFKNILGNLFSNWNTQGIITGISMECLLLCLCHIYNLFKLVK